MKPNFARRIQRRSNSNESSVFRKKSEQEIGFFSLPAHETFFQPTIQRKCEDCEKEEKKLQRMKENGLEKKDEKRLQKKEAQSTALASHKSNNVSTVLNTSGDALPASVNRFFSKRMNTDFSSVRLHTDSKAKQAAESINAQAFAYKQHLVFAEGKYQPGTSEGSTLLAHELAHVLQQKGISPEDKPARTAADEDTMLPVICLEGNGSNQENNTAYGCANVSVQGQTDANYSNSYSSALVQNKAAHCEGCEGDGCIKATGTLVSIFKADPTVTLPQVPGGLSRCEETAVRTFINTTLRRHEGQHVAAFNTYTATIRTHIDYTGCKADLDAHLLSIHDNIEQQRRAASDARSAALDPFNVAIPCNCQ